MKANRMFDTVTGIKHPMIADMYLKHHGGGGNILVVEARKKKSARQKTSGEMFDAYLVDLLVDLENLKHKVEKEVGEFSYIDIRR